MSIKIETALPVEFWTSQQPSLLKSFCPLLLVFLEPFVHFCTDTEEKILHKVFKFNCRNKYKGTLKFQLNWKQGPKEGTRSPQIPICGNFHRVATKTFHAKYFKIFHFRRTKIQSRLYVATFQVATQNLYLSCNQICRHEKPLILWLLRGS